MPFIFATSILNVDVTDVQYMYNDVTTVASNDVGVDDITVKYIHKVTVAKSGWCRCMAFMDVIIIVTVSVVTQYQTGINLFYS